MVGNAGGDDHHMRGLIAGGDVFRRIVTAFADASSVEKLQERAFRAGKNVALGEPRLRAVARADLRFLRPGEVLDDRGLAAAGFPEQPKRRHRRALQQLLAFTLELLLAALAGPLLLEPAPKRFK